MGISIIIPHWNGRLLAEANLPSVIAAAQRLNCPWEIIAVDDGSTDRLEEFLKAKFPQVRVVTRSRNEGFHAAMESGVANAKHALYYFLNSDVRVESETFQNILVNFDDPAVCAVASLDADKTPFCVPAATNHWGLLGVRYVAVPVPSRAMPVLFATGGHSVYRASMYREINGFDALYAPCYWEDIDFGVRARARGWKILLEPSSRVHHQPRGTIARKYTPAQIEGLRASHRWRFTKRHSPAAGPRAWVALALSHGLCACPPFSTRFKPQPHIEPQALSSRLVLQQFAVPAVKQAHATALRVAYISPTGAMGGGGEASLVTLLASFDRKQIHPIAVCPSEGPLATQLRAHGIDTHIVACPSTGKGLMNGALKRFSGWLRAQEIDLVHINSAGRTLMLWGAAARLLGIPVVWHVRVATKESIADKFAAAVASCLIVTSSYVASRFSKKRLGEKIVQIPNPVDLEKFSLKNDGTAWRKAHDLSGGVYIGVFGRFDEWKRFDLALQALALARKKEPQLRLLMVGDGPQRLRLESLAQRLGLGESLSFVGWQHQPAGVMAACDIVFHPTPTEHFGRVFIEAMASGKPVVAPKSGGAAELVGHEQTGLLALRAEPEAFAEALVRLAKDEPLRRQMGQAARARAEALYAPKPIAEQVLGVYNRLLGLA